MSGQSEFVSVVIPTFNRAHCIQECVLSVLHQTYSRLEVIVVDDGSTDETEGRMQPLLAADERVRYIKQKNGGVSSARNTGLRAALGNFIALLDSDDIWKPWKLEVQIEALRQLPDVGMVSSDMTAINPDGHVVAARFLKQMYGAYDKLGNVPLYPHTLQLPVPSGCDVSTGTLPVLYGDIYSKMLRGNLIHTPTVLLRRERWEQVGFFDESLRCGEDFVFHLQTCRFGPVACLDASTLIYQIGCDDQITHRRNHVPFARAFLSTIREELRKYPELNTLTHRERRRIFADAHQWLATDLLEIGHRGESLQHAAQTIRYAPLSVGSWKAAARSVLPHFVRRAIRKIRSQSATLLRKDGDINLQGKAVSNPEKAAAC